MRLSRAITVFSGELISVPTRTSGSPHQQKVHLRLVGDSQIRLAGGHQTRRQGRVRRRYNLDVQPCALKAPICSATIIGAWSGLMYQSSTRVSFSLAIACPLNSAVKRRR
jgi:hypothetical protein